MQNHTLPDVLRESPRWLRWQKVGSSKIPTPKSNAPALLPFAEVEREPRSPDGGIGFSFHGEPVIDTPDGPLYLIALDLDSCRDPGTGDLAPWAAAVVSRFGVGYSEVSPSGYGLRVFLLSRVAYPAAWKSKAKVQATPLNPQKEPELQVFARAGYVTVTGDVLAGCTGTPQVVESLDWLADTYGLRDDRALAVVRDLPVGTTPAPSLDEIEAEVRRAPYGPELLAGEWDGIPPRRSASEVYHRLAGLVLRAAHGHGAVAVQFLLSRTAWGLGTIEGSREPDRYARRTWVEREVMRTAARMPTDPASVFDVLDVPADDDPEVQALAADVREALDPTDARKVVDAWDAAGPVVHLPTGLPSLDERTGGGLVLGSRVYIVGAPDAGKTALLVHLADTWTAAGVHVGILAVDEEPTDLVSRFLQRRGLTRRLLEERDPATMAQARAMAQALPLRLFDSATTIEAAAVALHKSADGKPTALLIDSIQVVHSSAEEEDATPYRAVTTRVAAVRAAASRYRMLVVSTSEMSRGAYRSKDADKQTTDLASAKESGAVEYSARVLLALRNVPGDSDHVELRIPKNKQGPSTRNDEAGTYLRTVRATQQITEDREFAPLDDVGAPAAEASEGAREDARQLVQVLVAQPGLGVRAMRAAMRLRGISSDRAEAARELLGAAVVVTPGKGQEKCLSLDAGKCSLDFF